MQIAVTVVDRGGHSQVMLRDVLAMDITVEISKQKAHTAMVLTTALSILDDGLIIGAGGIPINIGGAPSGVTDEKCAWFGLEAVSDDLQMIAM